MAMNWEGRKIVVTGAGGFIGSHLTESLLEKGANVTALVHYNSQHNYGWLEEIFRTKGKELSVVMGDVRDSNAMRKLVDGHTVIFHLAALIGIPYSYMAPEAYIETNIKGTLNVLQAGLENKVERVIHTSTSEVYGTAKYVPIDEDHPLQGQSPYSASKIGADKLVESYCKSFDLPVVTVRPFNTFGPRQSARAVIPTIISQVLQGKELRLGSLKPVRDMTFVDDTVRGFIAASESKAVIGETVNLGTGQGISIQELVETISSVLNQNITVISEDERVRPEKSEVMRLISCADKAEKLMNWEARVSLKEGLAKTITWISENLKSYKEEKYVY
jgi:NAD dependent epimerase/dehydratase